MGGRKESEGTGDVGEFLDKQYKKFAIMGIFGTVTIFLNNQPLGGSDSLSARLAIVASLLIFALSATLIARESLSEISSEGGIPTFDDVGLVVILLCSSILGIVVVGTVSTFSLAVQILFELTFVIIGLLIYLRFSPILTYMRGENLPKAADGEVAVASSLLFTALLLGPYSSYIIRITENVIGVRPVLGSSVILASFPVHFLFVEGFIGSMHIYQKVERMDISADQLIKPWSLRSSVAISVISIWIATYHASETTKAVVGPNHGYYRILGMDSTGFSILHWSAIIIAFGIIVAMRDHYGVSNTHVVRAGQAVAALSVIVLIVDIFVIIPNGVHVLPI